MHLSSTLKSTVLTLCGLMLVMGTSGGAVITLTGLSNTDWASATDDPLNPDRYNSTIITQDSLVVGDRDGAPGGVGDGSNTATLDVSTFLDDGDGNPSGAPLAYTVGGLDLDGVGGFNDSMVLTFTVTSSVGGVGTPGGTSSGPGNPPVNQGYLNLATGGNLNNPGEFIEFVFSDLSVNLNGGTDNGSGIFDGFSGVQLANVTATTTPRINGVTLPATGVTGDFDVDLTPGGLDSGLLMEDGGAGRFYANTWDVQVTIIPEPSTALLSLLAVGLLVRRRR